MTKSTTNILIRPISLTSSQLVKVKKNISQLNWGVLLESPETGHSDARWSIYSAFPFATLQTTSGLTQFKHDNETTVESTEPFAILEKYRKLFFAPSVSDLPFTGGALGYFSYELGYQLETIKTAKKPSGLDLPEMMVGLYDWALLYDNQIKQLYLVVHKHNQSDENLEVLWNTRFDWILQQSKDNEPVIAFHLKSKWQSNMNKKQYHNKFQKVQDYILSGDCYQVNLAQRFQASYQGDEYQAYQALYEENTPPFAAFIRLPQHTILSLSPERFIKLSNESIETKPIKGTRPRYIDKVQDDMSRKALLNSEKDRAENLMIVDLLRNDIGRVSEAGSVTVPKLFAIESFPAVHHLVSTVNGKLATSFSTEDLLRACFPGGSITGAPKIRAMEVIAELEPQRRQLYCGSIAYINSDGKMDSNISIRTLICNNDNIYCWAGGGIVADSDVSLEYQECFDKVSKILPCLEKLNKS